MTRPGVEFGMSYRIPAVPVSLPLASHPDFERLEPDLCAWLRPYLTSYFGESDDCAPRPDGVLKQRYPEWGAMIYPHCHSERFFAIEAVTFLLALVDDAFAAPMIQNDIAARVTLLERLNRVIDDAVQPVSPLERLVAAGQKLVSKHPPVSVQRRLTDHVKEVFKSTAAESTESSAVFKDMDSYLVYRRVNVFGLYCLTLTEWGLGFDLQEHVHGDRDLAAARDLVINHWILVNDIYSFPKEIESGEKVNGVWIVMDRQGLSLQAALDRLAELAVETETRFIAIRDRILAGPLGHHPHIPGYLRELSHSIPGNLHYHRKSSRYHRFTRILPNTDAGTATPEHTVLYRRGTAHEPAWLSGFQH
ncbi:terpene synthase metal binding domain protein [Penicillium sp. IBT 31633x]|nr:terpene synthase metal binding domain protein [Penicillium sp. IBT 31633x]